LVSESTPNTRAEWQSCRADSRCARGARYVTGADIVRISQTLALEPWHFTETAPAAAGDPTGIVLDGGRRRVNLRLANANHGCIFLVRTLTGAGRCGLGDLAPASCRMFPADPPKGAKQGCQNDGCGCQEWAEQRDSEALAEALRGWVADRDHWYELIRRWNALAAESGDDLSVEDFQRYLLEAQAAREAGEVWPEEVAA